MNKRKIMSTICALSLAATSFAAMTFTAKAEGEEVLWSDNFNNYENVVDHFNQSATLGKVLADGTLGQAIYKGINGLQLRTCSRSGGDDSSWFKLYEKDDNANDKYLTTLICRFARQNGGSEIAFVDGEAEKVFAPTADKELVVAFKIMYTDAGETGYDVGFTFGSTFVNIENAGIEPGTWATIKAVVTNSGTSFYVNDAAEPFATGLETSISTISFDSYIDGVVANDAIKTSSHPTGYPVMSVDDIVVYLAADGKASEIPAAGDQEGAEIEYTYAPTGTKPEGYYNIANVDFNSANPDRLIFTGDGNTEGYTAFDGIVLTAGQGGDARGESKWSTVANKDADPTLGKDMYIVANNGNGSTANRGPQLAFTKEVAERENVVVQFATRLHKSDNAPAELIFSGDLVASESKGNLASPLAMITTDKTADSAVYSVEHPLEKEGANVLEVNDNEWVLVTINATRAKDKTTTASIAVTRNEGTADEETVYIFGTADEKAGIVDNTGHGVNNIPYVTFRSGNDTDYGVSNTWNDIDNVAVYTDTKPAAIPDVDTTATINSATKVTAATASATAVVIKATKNDDGTVTAELHKGLVEGENEITWKTEAKAGDTIYVFGGFTSLRPATIEKFVVADSVE